MRLEVGEPVAREDGRFYIPLRRAEATTDSSVTSDIVLRVASDAFATIAEATTFANMIALSYAQCTEILSFGVGDPILMHGLEQVDDYNWALKAYGDVVDGQRYQALRLLEEVCELMQTQGLTLSDIDKVAKYVYGRAVGDENIEIGDVQICLNILAMTRHRSVAKARVTVHKKLALRTPEALRSKDKAKMDAGLI